MSANRKYATYEAKNFRKVVSKQKTNLQKVSGVYVKRVKICGEKTAGGQKWPPPPGLNRVNENKHFCKNYGLDLTEKEVCLPIMYWMPKMHKSPVGFRFIVA